VRADSSNIGSNVVVLGGCVVVVSLSEVVGTGVVVVVVFVEGMRWARLGKKSGPKVADDVWKRHKIVMMRAIFMMTTKMMK
jgi:hypothetical protein